MTHKSRLSFNLLLTAALAATLGTTLPAAADGRGNRHGDHRGEHRGNDHRGNDHRGGNIRYAHCPPGLAKKSPACVPPGQARQQGYYGYRRGDIIRRGDVIVLRDPGRYELEQRRGWDYYRDDNRIYRVDRNTQRILAVMNLIQAFSN